MVMYGIIGYLHLMFSGISSKDDLEFCQYIAGQDARETAMKKLTEIVNL